MKDVPEKAVDSSYAGPSTGSIVTDILPPSSDQTTGHTGKVSLWSSLFSSNFSIFESHASSAAGSRKASKFRNSGWTAAVKRVVTRGTMRRFQERILGTSRADISSSTSEIWLLGTSYKPSSDEPRAAANPENDLAAFLRDFSSRIWITYRKGFDAIGDSRFTSDAGWGCMIRSSQMLVAQALLIHHLGRPWRKSSQKPYDSDYIKILHQFGDSEECAFSIHNLLQAGKGYGLAAGSWVGPYAMCRTWETLTRSRGEYTDHEKRKETLPMAVYIVSGDEDGERGGAPVVCIDVASRRCSDFNNGEGAWAPILLLVPLVLGLEKVNPRYIPLLWNTFTFPQSLGIMGGKPGASTCLVGVQDDKALYLDPHEVQSVVEIKRENFEADTSSYHSNTVRNLPLDQIDPSLAIGFYCRDEEDFKDFCHRASELAERSNGAPLFTVTQSLKPPRPSSENPRGSGSNAGCSDECFDPENHHDCGGHAGDDDWQLL